MNGFIVVALDIYDQKSYIRNTGPLLWTSKINEAKCFEAYKFAKNDLEDDFISLSATIAYANIQSVWILEYINDVEMGRERFL